MRGRRVVILALVACAFVTMVAIRTGSVSASPTEVRVVADRAQWDAAFHAAAQGTVAVIQIAPNSTIDISHPTAWVIPDDVRLEGNSETTVLTSSIEHSGIASVLLLGDNAVVSGVILRGPLANEPCYEPYDLNCIRRISANASGGVTLAGTGSRVEFSEITGFHYYGVRILAGQTRVHANHIHRNGYRVRADGGDLGYGVLVLATTATPGDIPEITYNRFSHHRHAITTPGRPALNGQPGHSYIARYNLDAGRNRGAVFDVHGWVESEDGRDSDSTAAGDTFEFTGNVSLDPTGTRDLDIDPVQASLPLILLRGTPSSGAMVNDNCVVAPPDPNNPDTGDQWIEHQDLTYLGLDVNNIHRYERVGRWAADVDQITGIDLEPLTQSSCVLPLATCNGQTATISGATHGNDILWGTPGPDVINGLGGNDIIVGLGGDDIICGGPGDDIIRAGSGQNMVFATSGNVSKADWRGSDVVVKARRTPSRSIEWAGEFTKVVAQLFGDVGLLRFDDGPEGRPVR